MDAPPPRGTSIVSHCADLAAVAACGTLWLLVSGVRMPGWGAHRTACGGRAAPEARSVASQPQTERCVMRFPTRFFLVLALVAAVFTPLPRAAEPQTRAAGAAPAGSDAVLVWNAHAGVAATKACIAPLADPFHESRLYAMMHLAIHDALDAIDRRFRPYTFDQQAAPGASPEAAVAAAARA